MNFSVLLTMVYCAAVDLRRTTGIYYRRFPRDESFSRFCAEHFTLDCYERDLKAELLGEKPKFILKPDAVPLLFSNQVPPKKSRLSSEQRTSN